MRRLCAPPAWRWSAIEQRHRCDPRGGGYRRCEGFSRCQQHAPDTAVQGAHRRHAEATRPHLPLRHRRALDQPRRTDRLGRPRQSRGLLRPSPFRPRVPGVHRAHADTIGRNPAAVPARTSRPRAGQLAPAGRLISYKSDSSRNANFGAPKAEESPMGKVVMYSSVSVDGFIADENDQPGPLFDWLSSGDVPLDESGVLEGVADVLRLHPAVLGPDRGDNRRPPRLRHDGRLGREASERDRPRGRRDAPAGARGLGPRGAVSLRRRRRGSRGQGAGACG